MEFLNIVFSPELSEGFIGVLWISGLFLSVFGLFGAIFFNEEYPYDVLRRVIESGSICDLKLILKVLYYTFIYNVAILGACIFYVDVVPPWWVWVVMLFGHVFVAGVIAFLAYILKWASQLTERIFNFLFEKLEEAFEKVHKLCKMLFNRLLSKFVQMVG